MVVHPLVKLPANFWYQTMICDYYVTCKVAQLANSNSLVLLWKTDKSDSSIEDRWPGKSDNRDIVSVADFQLKTFVYAVL